MTASHIPKDHPRRLIVEGQDLHTIIQLMARHDLDWNTPPPLAPYVFAAGSVERALKDLRLSLSGDFDRIGIIIDADADVAARWHSARDRFGPAGIRLPATPPAGGWVGVHEGRRFGVWIMPDNLTPGKLEHFLSPLIPADDPCWPLAQETAKTAKERGAPFRDIDTVKAELSTWLAWRNPPGIPYGTAMNARCFQHDTPQALAFVAWFKRLFLEDGPA